MKTKKSLKGVSLFVLLFAMLFGSMGIGGSQAKASEQGMLSTNYVTENSVSIHFVNNIGRGEVSLSKDGEVYYTTTAYTFDYVVTSLQPNTTYLFQINGTTTMGKPIYDEMSVTTTAIPEEAETVGPNLGQQVGDDGTSDVSPTFDDTTYGGATTDSYFEGVKRTSGWDLVGSDKFYMPNNTSQQSLGSLPWVSWYGKMIMPWNGGTGSIIYSTGGEFKIRVKGVSVAQSLSGTGNLSVTLYEQDSKYVFSKVKEWSIDPRTTDRDLIIKNAGDYVDGDNKKAEFYIYVATWYKPYGSYHTFNYYD